MVTFTKLLHCVTEDDAAALRPVARLAAATGAGLTLADVVEPVPAIARRLLPRSWDLPALVRAQKAERLERASALAGRLGVAARTALLTGAPFQALVREVTRGRHDLLTVGAGPAGTVRCVGVSATRLLRECPCPVLLVHPARRRRRFRVLVAVDTGSLTAAGTDALNAKLLECALWFAGSRDGEVHVLHAWAPFGARYLRGGGVTDAEVEKFLGSVREEARHDLERTVAPFRTHIPRSRVHLVQGDRREVIADFAADSGVDLLVMGTVARSGLAARIVGNTAEALLTRFPCSMLVVKPDDAGAPSRGRRTARQSTGRPGRGADVDA